jgi:L-threonylcarbamoyladenylate synthase
VLDGLEGRIDAVLDSGPCAVGVESTVLDLTGSRPLVLRPGGVAREQLAALLGPIDLVGAAPGAIRSPGLLASHYAPALPVRLEATEVAADEALLAFGPPLAGAAVTQQLSAGGDCTEAAANLFAGLRILDLLGTRQGLRGIAAMPVPQAGLGLAINDRLRRAAAPRTA